MEIEKAKEQNKENGDHNYLNYLARRSNYAFPIFYHLTKLPNPYNDNVSEKIPEKLLNDCNKILKEKLKELTLDLEKLDEIRKIGEDCIGIIDGLTIMGANKFKGKCELI